MGLLLPFVLQVWLGRFAPVFTEIGELCLFGWALNTLNTPAYFMFLGIGKLRWPVLAQTVIGVLSAVLGIIFGYLAGGFGVLAAVALTLAFASQIVLFAFHSQHNVPWHWLMPRESWSTGICAVVGTLCVFWSAMTSGTSTRLGTNLVVLSFAIALSFFSFRNPNARVLFSLLAEMRKLRPGVRSA